MTPALCYHYSLKTPLVFGDKDGGTWAVFTTSSGASIGFHRPTQRCSETQPRLGRLENPKPVPAEFSSAFASYGVVPTDTLYEAIEKLSVFFPSLVE